MGLHRELVSYGNTKSAMVGGFMAAHVKVLRGLYRVTMVTGACLGKWSEVVPVRRPSCSRTDPASCPAPQPSADAASRSQLERYLQEELDTMRHAFQIRLSQLEKRYQRQLILEQRKGGATRSHAQSDQVQLRPVRGDATTPRRNSRRRNSWHTALQEQELDAAVAGMPSRSDSTHTLDSDCGVSESDDIIAKRQGGIPDEFSSAVDAEGRGSAQASQPGLKGGASGWREVGVGPGGVVPRLSPTRAEEEGEEGLTEESRRLIHSKMTEYRDKMTRHFREQSEARIAAMEVQYQGQMGELERLAEERASQRLVAMEKRLKDLESRLEVQTLV